LRAAVAPETVALCAIGAVAPLGALAPRMAVPCARSARAVAAEPVVTVVASAVARAMDARHLR
jgi:hypothetical protein